VEAMPQTTIKIAIQRRAPTMLSITSTECAYYKLTIDGKDVIEVDVINMVLMVDGVDRLAEHRKAIGL
jgi:P2 family phage contractile tail tube protein